jgi:hypothetical protein
MPARLLSAKVAAVATVAVLGAGTAAAAMTGGLPVQAISHAPSHAKPGLAMATSRLAAGSRTHDTGAPRASTSVATGAAGTGPLGGTANGNAAFGLMLGQITSDVPCGRPCR